MQSKAVRSVARDDQAAPAGSRYLAANHRWTAGARLPLALVGLSVDRRRGLVTFDPCCNGLDTALRETEEEIGLGAAEIRVLAELDPIEARTTGFRVVPFLARVPSTARWRAQPCEIADVITPRVDTLLDPGRRRTELLTFPTWPEPRMTHASRSMITCCGD